MSTTSPLATMVQRFSEWARKAGLQYQGKRDVFASAGYLRSGTEHFDDYWSLFVRNEIAARIVELPVGSPGAGSGEDLAADEKGAVDLERRPGDRSHRRRWISRRRNGCR